MSYYKIKVDLNEQTLARPLVFYAKNLTKRSISVLSSININTIRELFERENEYLYWFVRWLGKKCREEIISFKEELLRQNVQHEENNEISTSQVIPEEILSMRLEACWKYLSLRTRRALAKAKIQTVSWLYELDLSNKRSLSIGWLGAKWIQEIRTLKENIQNDNNTKENKKVPLKDFIDDNKLLNKLSFNLISNIEDLSRYFHPDSEWPEELKFINEDEQNLLKTIYNEQVSKKKWERTPDLFAQVLTFNLSDRDKVILKGRFYEDKTLEEMWSQLWITRERVRQKEKGLLADFEKIGKEFLLNNQELYEKFMQVMNTYGVLTLPKDIHLLEFLGFNQEDQELAYYSLKWVNNIRWEMIEYKKIYILFLEGTQLSSDEIVKLHIYLQDKLKKNNEDIKIEDIYYGFIASENLVEKYPILSEKIKIIPLIKSLVELNNDYLITWEVIHRFKKKYKIDYCILEILKDYPDWIHYTDLRDQIQERFNLDLPAKKVLTHLAKTKNQINVINIWLGTYTLKSSKKYSGEITSNVAYSILQDKWVPMKFDDLANEVLKKKIVNKWTVKAALNYKKEFRFCFFKDHTIWLKEWNLPNTRAKHETYYEIPIKNAFEILMSEGKIKKHSTLTINEFLTIVEKRFGKKSVSLKKVTWNHLLLTLSSQWVINVKKEGWKGSKFIF